jgi:hypothetical protein
MPASSIAASRAARLTLLLFLLIGFVRPLQAAPLPASTANSQGTWVQLPPPVLAPAIDGGTACWDPVRGRMLVFGGRNVSGVKNDVWVMTPGGAAKWEQLFPLGTPPAARYAHTMVYDSQRDRMIVYGGSPNGTTAFGDVFELTLSGTPTWNSIVAANPPPARMASVAVYDPVGDRMVIYGGLASGNNLGDTWLLSFAGGTPTWTEFLYPQDPGPGPRSSSAAIYDPVGQRMLLCGGAIGAGPPRVVFGGDVWALRLTEDLEWYQPLVGGALPGGRRGHAAMYDSDRKALVVFGGWNGSGWVSTASVLPLNALPTWQTLGAVTERPVECERAMLVYDPVGKRGILFGGSNTGKSVSRAWSLSFTPNPWWSLLEPAPPSVNGMAAVYDPVRKELVQFGGKANFGSTELAWVQSAQHSWSLSLGASPAWNVLAVPGTPVPEPRDGPIVVRDPANDRLLMFGGAGTTGEFRADVWALDLATRQWSKLATAGPVPPGRWYAGGGFDPVRSRFFVFSGENFGQLLDDFWELDLLPSPTWKQITLSGSRPIARFSPAMLYDPLRDRMLLFGGVSLNGTYLGDTWALSAGDPPAWSPLATSGTPPRAAGNTTVYDSMRDRLLVFGGMTTTFLTSAVSELRLTGPPAWSSLVPAGTPPPPRSYGVAVYDPVGDRMIVTQGQGPAVSQGDGWSLEFGDSPTPTLLTFADEELAPGSVRLTWYTPEGAGQRAIALRSREGADWEDIAELVSDAAGRFVLADDVPGGGRFGYRLVLGGEFTETHWVTVPAGIAFGLTSTGANPSRGELPVTFALSAEGAATLDVYAVNGRRVLHRDVTALGAGVHSVDLARGENLANGIYVIQLTQGVRTAQRKIVVVR